MIRMARQVMKESWTSIGKSGLDVPAPWLELLAATGTPTGSWESRANRLPSYKMSPEGSTNGQDAYLQCTQAFDMAHILGLRIRWYGVECSSANGMVIFGARANNEASNDGAHYYDRGSLSGLGAGSWKTVLQVSDSAGVDSYAPVRMTVNQAVSGDAIYNTPKDIAFSIYREKPNGSTTFKQYVRIELDETPVYEGEHDSDVMDLTDAIKPCLRVANQSNTQCHLWVAGGDLTIWA